MAEHHRFAWRTWTTDDEFRLFKGSDEYATLRREKDHQPSMTAWWEVLICGVRVTRHPYLPTAKTLGIIEVKKRLAVTTPGQEE